MNEKLQLLEQSLQQILMQKQSLHLEQNELSNALSELNKASDPVFRVIGSVMIKADKNWFGITFKRPDLEKESYEQRMGGQKRWSDKWSEKELTEKQVMVLKLINENPKISRRELVKKLGINPSAIQKHLGALKEKGVLRRVGGAKGGYWVVVG